jgi:hypothetical protein
MGQIATIRVECANPKTTPLRVDVVYSALEERSQAIIDQAATHLPDAALFSCTGF